jgi:hypothetical protein
LQCRNKDGKWARGQPEFCFRPARFYGLPRAQKFHPVIGNRVLINHKPLIYDFLLHYEEVPLAGQKLIKIKFKINQNYFVRF